VKPKEGVPDRLSKIAFRKNLEARHEVKSGQRNLMV
jgi:hypothetical protein